VKNERSIFAPQAREATTDAYQRLIAPSIERELRNARTDEADDHAIKVFATNLRNLLLQPPLRGKTVMGIDPGYRTGCKAALVDETGKFVGGTTIYPHTPQKQWDEARELLVNLVTRGKVDVIAIGNGTACRETEALVAEVIAQAVRLHGGYGCTRDYAVGRYFRDAKTLCLHPASDFLRLTAGKMLLGIPMGPPPGAGGPPR